MRGLAARLGIVVTIILATSAIGFAQWVHYPTAGIPRKDGKPDLAAPAPRLADGKPDLSGLWRGNPNRCTSKDGQTIPCGVEIGGSPLGGNLGRNLEGGLPYQPWAAELARKRRADFARDDPHVRCMPDSPPRTWTLPHLTKIIHTPSLLVTLYEVNAQYPSDLPRRPAVPGRSDAWMAGILGGPLGWRHDGDRNPRVP